MSVEQVQPERVYRFCKGGALIGRLRGEPEDDGFYPEDWVGSTVEAINPGRDELGAGLARLADGRLLRDVVAADPEHWLGKRHVERFGVNTGLLVKLLDAAERLPVHAHPNRPFARAHFGSAFGKTEAWIVVATREPQADLWVGLRDEVSPETYRDWINRQDTGALLESLHRISVSAGDIVFVPAGLPHAIGAGVLIAELQEPTDYSIICEWDGFPIRAEDSHLGLGWNVAFHALDLSPRELRLGLPPEAAEFFWADETAEPAGRFAVLIVLGGEGTIDNLAARAGNGFVVPASCGEFEVTGDLRILRCLAPDT